MSIDSSKKLKEKWKLQTRRCSKLDKRLKYVKNVKIGAIESLESNVVYVKIIIIKYVLINVQQTNSSNLGIAKVVKTIWVQQIKRIKINTLKVLITKIVIVVKNKKKVFKRSSLVWNVVISSTKIAMVRMPSVISVITLFKVRI